MELVLLQILQWILRIIGVFFLAIFVGTVLILIVPVRYRAEGEVCEESWKVKGKASWFFYLISMRFLYEEEFQMQIRVLGVRIYDSEREKKKTEKKRQVKKKEAPASDRTAEKSRKPKNAEKTRFENKSEIAVKTKEETTFRSLPEKTAVQERKAEAIRKRMKDFWKKLKEIRVNLSHYLELWHREETQATFQRAKKKFGRVLHFLWPKKWEITGNIGLEDPALTGELMGILGSLYPILGSKVRIVPDFERKVTDIKGRAKGHIRMGNLLYQMLTLILNPHCLRFIRLVFQELDDSKMKKKEK